MAAALTLLSGQSVRVTGMRLWLLAAVVVAVALVALVVFRDDGSRCIASVDTYDGSPLPDGPRTPDEALEGFLDADPPRINASTGDTIPADPEDYTLEGSTFTAGKVQVLLFHRDDGVWSVSGLSTSC